MFSKGDNIRDFFCPYLEDKVLPKRGKKLLRWEQISSFMRRPYIIGGGGLKLKWRVASPESVPFHLNVALSFAVKCVLMVVLM